MNCEQFRRRLMIDPYSPDVEFRVHSRRCPACAEIAAEALAFEDGLRAALEAELAGDTRASMTGRVPARLKRVRALLFLSLVLVTVWFLLRIDRGATDWQGLVLGHIEAESGYLDVQGRVPWSRLSLLFHDLDLVADPGIGPVAFAGRCRIGSREGIHLVIPGERGPVTMMFMPGEELRRERTIQGKGLLGLVLPVGSGSLAVVGMPGEPLMAAARRLLSAVHSDRSASTPTGEL